MLTRPVDPQQSSAPPTLTPGTQATPSRPLTTAEEALTSRPAEFDLSNIRIVSDERPSAPPYYQEVIDLLAEHRAEQPDMGRVKITLAYESALEALLTLARTLDEAPEPRTVDALLDAMLAYEALAPSLVLSTELISDMTERMILAGAEDAARRFMAWRYRRVPPIFVGHESRASSARVQSLNITDAGAALAATDVLTLAVEQLSDLPGIWDNLQPELGDPHPNRALILTNIVSIHQLMQVVMEEAITLLGARGEDVTDQRAKAERLLLRAFEVMRRLASVVIGGPAYQIADLPIETSVSTFDASGGTHHDAHREAEDPAAPSVGITFYDDQQKPELAREMTSTVAESILARRGQIEALLYIYGLRRDASGALTEDSARNAQALKAAGGLRLHSDDDWRNFSLEIYRQALASPADKQRAYMTVIETLQTYLQAFTAHTPYNIEDFEDNQLTMSFPRTLTGQLIHDCGVYALRAIYILSLIKDELQLSFQLVRLPVHVSLIVTGPGLPTIIAENDRLTPWYPSSLELLEQSWSSVRAAEEEDAGNPAPSFLGDLAAGQFVPQVDVPYKTFEVPLPEASSAAPSPELKEALWELYRTEVAPFELFGDPSDQLHLRYLALIDALKQHHNQWLLPFWNLHARPIWLERRAELELALNGARAAGPNATDSARAGREAYDRHVRSCLEAIYDGPAFMAVIDAFNTYTNLATQLQAASVEDADRFATSAQVARASTQLDTFLQANLTVPPWMDYRQIDHAILSALPASGGPLTLRFDEVLLPAQ